LLRWIDACRCARCVRRIFAFFSQLFSFSERLFSFCVPDSDGARCVHWCLCCSPRFRGSPHAVRVSPSPAVGLPRSLATPKRRAAPFRRGKGNHKNGTGRPFLKRGPHPLHSLFLTVAYAPTPHALTRLFPARRTAPPIVFSGTRDGPVRVLALCAVAGATAYIPAKPPPALAERGRTFERARGLLWCGPVRPAFVGWATPYGLPDIAQPTKAAVARSLRLVRASFLRECKRSHPPLCSRA